MKVLVVGASGRTGHEIVKECVAKGHHVTALARDPARLDAPEGVEVVEGDVTAPDTLDAALAAQDAVLNAVGPSKGAPHRLRTTAAQNLVAAMGRNGVRRLVQLSTFGTGDSKGKGGFVFDTFIAPLVMKKTLVDQEGAEAAVRSAEGIEWVMVRPARLTNADRSETAHVVFDGGKASWKASRSDVAAFMVAQLEDDTYLGQAPGLVA